MLTFDLLAKVGHIGVPSIYQNIVFSESTMHMKTPYYKLAKIYVNCSGHLTKRAARPIYDKKPLKLFLSRTKMDLSLSGVTALWSFSNTHLS